MPAHALNTLTKQKGPVCEPKLVYLQAPQPAELAERLIRLYLAKSRTEIELVIAKNNCNFDMCQTLLHEQTLSKEVQIKASHFSKGGWWSHCPKQRALYRLQRLSGSGSKFFTNH